MTQDIVVVREETCREKSPRLSAVRKGWGRESTSYLVDPVLGGESKALREAERRDKRWII